MSLTLRLKSALSTRMAPSTQPSTLPFSIARLPLPFGSWPAFLKTVCTASPTSLSSMKAASAVLILSAPLNAIVASL